MRIRDEWESMEKRRCELIEKRIKSGQRTPEEESEFRQLQRLLTIYRRFYGEQPILDNERLERALSEDRGSAAKVEENPDPYGHPSKSHAE